MGVLSWFQLDILALDDWAAMHADMEEMCGAARDGINAANALAAMSDEERAAFIEQMKAAEEAAPAKDARANASFSKPNPHLGAGNHLLSGHTPPAGNGTNRSPATRRIWRQHYDRR